MERKSLTSSQFLADCLKVFACQYTCLSVRVSELLLLAHCEDSTDSLQGGRHSQPQPMVQTYITCPRIE